MAIPDKAGGLWSRMAGFVRLRSRDEAEPDRLAPPPDSGYGKQALKKLIERKRQNDFVRRREFDYLRQLRRNAPVMSFDSAGHSSFFQSSLPSSPDERAMTLKKIDDIEAQMSRQWWMGQPEAGVPANASPPRVVAETRHKSVTQADNPPTFAPTQPSGICVAADSAATLACYESTQMGWSEPAVVASMGAILHKRVSAGRPPVDTGCAGCSTSQEAAAPMGAAGSDLEMEDAAIRFANGDDAGAEAALVAALQAHDLPPEQAAGRAAALCDLYRVSGQQDRFESAARDYARRFGRVAPASGLTMVWACPAELDMPDMQALRADLSRAGAGPWHLSWHRLGTITPDAGKALAELFAEWCRQPVQLHFDGVAELEKTLRSCTPSGDATVPMFWWLLRLEALRLMRLRDEFDLAALDFCLVHEVSPPPWVEASCEFIAADGPCAMRAAAVLELRGEVQGDAAGALVPPEPGLQEAGPLVISCANLVRVDFSAAGSLLNWVAVRESEGWQVQFREVPPLVAAFFNLIGINEHAQIGWRSR